MFEDIDTGHKVPLDRQFELRREREGECRLVSDSGQSRSEIVGRGGTRIVPSN